MDNIKLPETLYDLIEKFGIDIVLLGIIGYTYMYEDDYPEYKELGETLTQAVNKFRTGD